MRRKKTYDIVLFGILALLSFMPMMQGHLHIIPLEPLSGITVESANPEFNIDAFRSGDYAKQKEAYVGENFGFRELVLRLYNQYLWACYKKTYAKDVVPGKNGWLYYPQSVNDYYGKELLRWHASVEDAKHDFDLEVKYLHWARTILKENGVDLMVFMAPEKGFLYPEHLPDRERDTTTFNAREYFESKFIETGFPCIEMTRWFKQMKDTVDYPLIPQTGAHWVFPAVFAADSLFRFMGEMKGIELPRIKIGELREIRNPRTDNDLEFQLNLLLPMRHQYGFCPRADVKVESDTATVKPKVLFIGNSYMWNIALFVPLAEVFDKVEFWYYFSTVYYGEGLGQTTSLNKMELLERLLDFDYVVWFTTGNQMSKGTAGFAKTALVSLCVGDSLMLATANRVKDSLSIGFWEAKNIIMQHPDLIPELRGDSLRIRSSEIPYAKIIKDIRKDSAWMSALETQAFLRTANMKMMLHAEADRIMQGKPLYRDQHDELLFGEYCQKEVEELMSKMPNNLELMESIKQKAEMHNKTLEKALEDDAIWIIRQKYGLDTCQLINNPRCKIPIPFNYQSK